MNISVKRGIDNEFIVSFRSSNISKIYGSQKLKIVEKAVMRKDKK
jgi:hypothetical protein